MSAPRQLLAWLWAAAWLRWRLVGVKARRFLGGGPAAAVAGPGYHLAPADVPVEGVDYDPAELPAGLAARLEDTRTELLDRARSTAARRTRRRGSRRRRAFSLATAALVTLATLGAAATALIAGSTGVPAVDRWLGIYEAALEKPKGPDRFWPGGPDVRPGPAGAGPSIEIPLSGGSRRLLVTSYVARSGDICFTFTGTDRSGVTGTIGCVTAGFLGPRLVREEGLVAGSGSAGDMGLLVGFVTTEIDRISARGPTNSLDAYLGDSWTPDVARVGSLRPFVVVDRNRVDVVDPRDYAVRVQTGRGRPTEIRP